jgi:hypothetical protein
VKCMYDGQSDPRPVLRVLRQLQDGWTSFFVGDDPQRTLTVTWAIGRTTIFTNVEVREPSDPCMRNGASSHPVYDMSDHYENRWRNPISTFERAWYTSPPGV